MTPFLITPKMIEGEMYCCTLDGMRRTVGVPLDVEGNSAIGGDGPWFMGDDEFGAGEFGDIIFATCCGTSAQIDFVFTDGGFGDYSWDIFLNGFGSGDIVDSGSSLENESRTIEFENRPCGNLIMIRTTVEFGSLTANATVV